jgi:hypothetical protein
MFSEGSDAETYDLSFSPVVLRCSMSRGLDPTHARAWEEPFWRYRVKTDFRAVRDQIGEGGYKLMKVFLSEEQIEC